MTFLLVPDPKSEYAFLPNTLPPVFMYKDKRIELVFVGELLGGSRGLPHTIPGAPRTRTGQFLQRIGLGFLVVDRHLRLTENVVYPCQARQGGAWVNLSWTVSLRNIPAGQTPIPVSLLDLLIA